jgi:hypothetical protein
VRVVVKYVTADPRQMPPLYKFLGRDSLFHEGVKINDFSEKHVLKMLEKFGT